MARTKVKKSKNKMVDLYLTLQISRIENVIHKRKKKKLQKRKVHNF